MNVRSIILAGALLLGGCSEPSPELVRLQKLPDTDVKTVTTSTQGVAEVEINGVRCITYRRGDDIGGGGGLSCDWSSAPENERP